MSNVLTISSGTIPSISGSYDCGPEAVQQMMTISLYILMNGTFPGAKQSWSMSDINGQAHVFPTTGAWQTFFTAIMDNITLGVLSSPVPPILSIFPGTPPASPPPVSSGGSGGSSGGPTSGPFSSGTTVSGLVISGGSVSG
jgi:hypothetical protein